MIGTASGILLASLVGSVHCAGMCGGFVCFYAGSANGTDAAPLRAHAMYNVGRLTSYLTLGAVAGAIGARVTSFSALAGTGNGAATAAGVLMILWAVSTLAAQRGVRIGALGFSGDSNGSRGGVPLAWQRALGTVLQRVRTQPMPMRAWLTGWLTTMLPCGWLYVFVAAAGGTGSVRTGVLTMSIFWLGTLPAMLAVGIGAQRLLMPLRARLPMLSAVTVLIMGMLSLTGRLSMQHAPAASAATATHSGHAERAERLSMRDAR